MLLLFSCDFLCFEIICYFDGVGACVSFFVNMCKPTETRLLHDMKHNTGCVLSLLQPCWGLGGGEGDISMDILHVYFIAKNDKINILVIVSFIFNLYFTSKL